MNTPVDLAALEEQIAALKAPPPWRWKVSKYYNRFDMYLFAPRHEVVMDFVRQGMQGAQPRFQDHSRGIMKPVKEWIDPDGLFDNPDAVYLETACTVLPELVKRLRAAEADLAQAREWARFWWEGGGLTAPDQQFASDGWDGENAKLPEETDVGQRQ